MSTKLPTEVAAAAETAPLLGASTSENGITATSNGGNNGTFQEGQQSTSSSHNVAEGGIRDNAQQGASNGPKIKVNMATLLPALAVGVSKILEFY